MTQRKPPQKSVTLDGDALWRHVTRNIKPFHSERPAPGPQSTGRAINIVHAERAAVQINRPIQPTVPQRAHDGEPFRNADLDRNTARRFARGDMPPEGHLDLHGYTLAEARRATECFLTRMSAAGARCVHIVTGKGERKGHERKEGRRTIKGEFTLWLAAPSLRALVLAVAPAGPRHGGGGAVYVLLRNRRKIKG